MEILETGIHALHVSLAELYKLRYTTPTCL